MMFILLATVIGAAAQGLYAPRRSSAHLILRGAIGGGGSSNSSTTSSVQPSSAWDQKPYDEFPSGTKYYLDEGDVVDFLHPPKPLIPLDPSSYNPASYLWFGFSLSLCVSVYRYIYNFIISISHPQISLSFILFLR